MSNVPVYDVDSISLGPGILFIGPVGATPTTDVGAISEDGMEFNLSREFLEVFQGQPKELITTFPLEEVVEVTIQGIEWNLMELPRALGAGVTTSAGGVETFAFGGSAGISEVAVLIQHSMPSGHTVSIYLWRCQPSGEWTMSMAQDTLHTFPWSFKALSTTTEWDGSALPSGQSLFRIKRETA